MAKLTSTERKMVAEVIVKRIKETFDNAPKKERVVDEYLSSLGIDNGLRTFKNNKKEYDKLIVKRKQIEDKMNKLTKIMRQDPTVNGYSQSIQNYDAFVNYQFQKANKVPSIYEIETEILLNGIEDVNGIVETMINRYTNNNE